MPVSLQPGSHVVTEGDHLGTIRHVVLSAHWIEKIDADSVRLAVSDTALESLETIT